MTIAQIELANTFDVWKTRTNQLITISNDLKEGNLTTSGTISMSNPSGFQSGVTLNVQSGMIYGDGGLLSNVGKPASIVNSKLQNNSISVTTSQGQIILSKVTIALGDSVFLNVANLVTVNTDTSTANIPSANLVNSVHKIAIGASITSSLAFDKANSANILAAAAYDRSNTANTTATTTSSSLAGLVTVIGQVDTNSKAAFAQANTANLRAVAAFTFANTRFSSSGGTISGSVGITGSLSVDGSLYVGGNTYFVDTTTLNIADPMIFLSSNNSADTVDIGFVGQYVNATSNRVLTGVFRDPTRKEYFIFREYSGNILNNNIDPTTNNFTLAVLNADIRTSNLNLAGQNTTVWITSAYNQANAANITSTQAFDRANAGNTLATTANNIAFSAFAAANAGAGVVSVSAYNQANAAFVKANLISVGTVSAKIGSPGDVSSMIRISNTHVFFAANSYTGGPTANVWRSIPLVGEFASEAPYMMLPYFYGNPSTANALIFLSTAIQPFYLPASLTGSYSRSRVVATGTTAVFELNKNGANIGTVNFAQSTNTATFTFSSRVDFDPGDVFAIIGNMTPDAGLADISFSILGYRR